MNTNIILHKFIKDSSNLDFTEIIPDFNGNYENYTLTLDSSGNLQWNPYNYLRLPNSPKNIGEYKLVVDSIGNLDWRKVKEDLPDFAGFITKKELNALLPDTSNFVTFEDLPDFAGFASHHFVKTEIQDKIFKNILVVNENFNLNNNVLRLNSILDDKGKFIGTENIYYINDNLFEIFLPENYLKTGLHIGNEKYGFSFGNGTTQGFIPQIIGMGSDDNDPGLYFIGKSKDKDKSNIPVVVIDGRDQNNNPIENRPIFGITNNGINSKFKFLVDQFGKVGIGKIPKNFKLEVEGTISANDVIVDGYSTKDLLDIIKNQQEQIDELKTILLKILDDE